MNKYDLPSIKSLFIEVLAEKPGSYVVDEIFSRFPSLVELMNVTETELTAIKGVGPRKARQIMAALKLARMLNALIFNNPHVIRSPKDAADLLLPRLRYLQQEHFVVIFLNTKNHVIGQPETISVGSLNAAIVHPREVFRAAIKQLVTTIQAAIRLHPMKILN